MGRTKKENLPFTNAACDGGPTQPARSAAAEWGSHCFTSLRPWAPGYAPPVALVSLSPAFGISCDLSRLVTSMAGSQTVAALLLVLVDLTTHGYADVCTCLQLLLISNSTVSG